MSANQYTLRTLNLRLKNKRVLLNDFLESEGLTLDADVDYSVCIEDGDRIIACGSAAGNVLKCIAVNHEYQGQGLLNRIMTYLRIMGFNKKYPSLYLFTKPDNESVFHNLGFFKLASAPEAVLMENISDGVQSYLTSLKIPKEISFAASIVMNCNPFTLGHRYLIEKACSENEIVHLFVLKEDLSVFPFELRMKLVQEGTADLKNLFIHEGRDYIISHATFPTYFMKEQKILNETHARLDLDLFSRKIAPALGITKRYVGEEPFCPVTSLYNTLMKELLPGMGISVIEIPRKTAADGAVSATKVRKALIEEKFDELKRWVPESTFSFLTSPEGKKIGDTLRGNTYENSENRTRGVTGVQ